MGATPQVIGEEENCYASSQGMILLTTLDYTELNTYEIISSTVLAKLHH